MVVGGEVHASGSRLRERQRLREYARMPVLTSFFLLPLPLPLDLLTYRMAQPTFRDALFSLCGSLTCQSSLEKPTWSHLEVDSDKICWMLLSSIKPLVKINHHRYTILF
jgi:hypothetical protein